MKDPAGGYKPHKGASKSANFEVQKPTKSKGKLMDKTKYKKKAKESQKVKKNAAKKLKNLMLKSKLK